MKKKSGKQGGSGKETGNCIDQVQECLFLGNLKAAGSLRVLEEHKIQNILQLVRMDPVVGLEGRVNVLRMPILGGKDMNIEPVLGPCLKFVHSCIAQGQTVLVHCKHGRNRSASVVIAYVMASKSLTLFEAERYVKGIRPEVKIYQRTKDLLNRLGYRGVQALAFN